MPSRKRTVSARRNGSRARVATQTAVCAALLIAGACAARAQGAEGKPASGVTSPASGPQAAPNTSGTASAAPSSGAAQSLATTAAPTGGPAAVTTTAKSAVKQPAPTAAAKPDWRKMEREKWQRLHAQKLAEQHAQALARQQAQQLAKQQAAWKQAQLLAQQHAQQVVKQQAQQQAKQLAAQKPAQAKAASAPPAAAVAAVPSAGTPAIPAQPATSSVIPPAALPAAASNQSSVSRIPNSNSSAAVPGASSGLLNEAKPDVIPAAHAAGPDRPLDSPFTAVGDAWKMLAYLVPMLLLIVGSLHLIRRFQQRTGQLRGAGQAAAKFAAPARSKASGASASGGMIGLLMGGLQRPQSARQNGVIRLVETVPLGGSSLHLVQVHGRMLLLGASGGSVSLLTEFEEQSGIHEDDFRALLRAAAADMDVLDLTEPDLPATTMVSALDEMMQETGEAVTRRVRRLRTVSDYDSAEDIHA